jgi:hypothetical protein
MCTQTLPFARDFRTKSPNQLDHCHSSLHRAVLFVTRKPIVRRDRADDQARAHAFDVSDLRSPFDKGTNPPI